MDKNAGAGNQELVLLLKDVKRELMELKKKLEKKLGNK